MSARIIEAEAATFAVAVLNAIKDLDGSVSYGEYYISEIKFGFDGDEAGFRITPNEFGGYDLKGLEDEK